MDRQTISLHTFCSFLLFLLLTYPYTTHAQPTYAEKLGYPEGAKVMILHIDDVGMSHESNMGAIKAMEQGVANSLSIMMPCSWVPEFAAYYKQHSELDAGLHLTLTSEWENYRWGPVSGAACAPSLVDEQGALYATVEGVVKNANPEEVEQELRAQIELARQMGFNPTHMDSHMGALFATPELLEIYIKLGIEYQIPVMLPAGHNTLLLESMENPPDGFEQMKQVGQKLWEAGLPVLDDLHNFSYSWKVPGEITADDKKMQEQRTELYINSFKKLQPGITMVIMHCTDPSENFSSISDSGPLRKADMLAMMDPELAEYISEEKIILTTWEELKKRREQLVTE